MANEKPLKLVPGDPTCRIKGMSTGDTVDPTVGGTGVSSIADLNGILYVSGTGDASSITSFTTGDVLTMSSNGAIIASAAPGTGGGEANTATNLGDEAVFKQKTGVDLEFRGVSAGPNIQLIVDGTNISISGTAEGGAGGGEANTGSNLGDQGIFKQKTGVDLEFRGVSAGPNIQLVTDATDVSISGTPDTTDHTALTNIGSNSHATIDSHIADATLHFTEGSIDHGAVGGLGDDDHTQYVLADGTRAMVSLDVDTTIVAGSGITVSGAATQKAIIVDDDSATEVFFVKGNGQVSSAGSIFSQGAGIVNTLIMGAAGTDIMLSGATGESYFGGNMLLAKELLVTSGASFGADVSGIGINELDDVSSTSPAAGQGLAWDGANYIPSTFPTGGGGGDHGGLTGLGDDDHTQYVLADGTRSMDLLHVAGDATFDANVSAAGILSSTGNLATGGQLDVGQDAYTTSAVIASEGFEVPADKNNPTKGDYLATIDINGNIDTTENLTVSGTINGMPYPPPYSFVVLSGNNTGDSSEYLALSGGDEIPAVENSTDITWSTANQEFTVASAGTYRILGTLVALPGTQATVTFRIRIGGLGGTTVQNVIVQSNQAIDPFSNAIIWAGDLDAADTVVVTVEGASGTVQINAGSGLELIRIA